MSDATARVVDRAKFVVYFLCSYFALLWFITMFDNGFPMWLDLLVLMSLMTIGSVALVKRSRHTPGSPT